MRPAALRYLEVPKAHREPQEEVDTSVWIPDPDVGYRLAKVIEQRGGKILVGFRDDNGFYEKKVVSKEEVQAPSVSYFCEDMCNLSELTDASVLHTVRCRYEAQLIHTYSGLFCLVVNPWRDLPIYTDDVMEAYASAVNTGTNLPPHVYSIAQAAYDGLFSGSNQSILITGESGAGKTENTKRILEYLGSRSGRRSQEDKSVDERLTAAGILIESFANASTIHNSNSSRVGKFIRMDFGDDMRLIRAQIQCFLLEKSRVVSQNEGDRNFHIFYQLLSNGFDEELRYSMGIGQKADVYRFLNQGGKTTDVNIDDAKGALDTEYSMKLIGFSEEERLEIYEIVTACILLGEIKFNERTGLDITYIEGVKEVEAACRILGVKTSSFIDALTQPSIKVGDVVIRKSQNLRKTLSSLSALCKCIYERLFNYILSHCNESLGQSFSPSTSNRTSYIGVLDMAGFEIMKKNSFEQFCINYTNEKLQQFFNDFMFIREQREYIKEGIQWKEVNYGTDMQNTIELIEKPLGLLSLLQEECLVPNGSDASLLEKLIASHSSSPVFARSKQSARIATVAHFSVIHYAGTVEYNIDGWVEKNKDAVEKSGLEALADSTKRVLRSLFPHIEEETGRSRRQSMCANTVSFVYKEQLLNLLETLNTTRAQFIRCISPNRTRTPGLIDPLLVLDQLRCNGVLEGVRICRQGFPNRLLFEDFVSRYRFIANSFNCEADRQGARLLCSQLGLDESSIQIGNSKVFCKVGIITELENRRRAKLAAILCGIQANIRWYIEQKELRSKMEKQDALLIIQRNIRNYAKLSTWRWYCLLGMVKQLIPLQKDKKRIEELEQSNQQLLKDLSDARENSSRLQKLLDEAQRKILDLENERNDREEEKKAMHSEMQKHEELMEIMERRFDEQHAKVMKIHSCLRENEKKMELIESEKCALEAELSKWKEKYERESIHRMNLEHEFDKCEQSVKELELKMDMMREERETEANRVQGLESEFASLKNRNVQQAETISELQRCICELTEKSKECDDKVATERKARKKAESEKTQKEDELAHLKEGMQRSAVKIETLKESCREKDREIKRLQAKLEDSMEKADLNIAEMKKIHKQSKEELQNKIDEIKKTCQRLEAENRSQKMKLESSERESSVESDYVSGGRQSRLGSRQYSLSSMGSFGSIRTLSRRTTEPDFKTTLGLRSPSALSVSYHHSIEPAYGLSRSSSQSQIANERKIAQLERQILNAHTDIQLQKREIEVYKASLAQHEKERDSLSQKLRTLTAEASAMERTISEEERKSHEYELRLQKAQNEMQALRSKYEQSLQDNQREILEERKKMRQKMEEMIQENEKKRSKTGSAERAVEELQDRLNEAHAQLDRALAKVAHLENLSKSQGAYGETWENQYRRAVAELEALRDENATLKTKIRRQHRQIELLTQQSEMEADVAELESKMGLALGRSSSGVNNEQGANCVG